MLLHKSTGVVVTAHDEQGRKTIYDLLPGAPSHLRYVGRLDIDTSGLLILTTDGELAHRLTHPSHEVEKENEARSEEHTSELQSLMRISYAVFCLKKKKT